jgi:hypothetical protein
MREVKVLVYIGDKEYILGEVENYVILSGSLVTITKMLQNIFCPRLTPPVDEIVRYHQC